MKKLYGALFENLVIGELRKYFFHKGDRPDLYYWRESNGSEIDCIVEAGENRLIAIEIKAGATYNPDYLKNLKRFPSTHSSLEIDKHVIYQGDINTTLSGIHVHCWDSFSEFLNQYMPS